MQIFQQIEFPVIIGFNFILSEEKLILVGNSQKSDILHEGGTSSSPFTCASVVHLFYPDCDRTDAPWQTFKA